MQVVPGQLSLPLFESVPSAWTRGDAREHRAAAEPELAAANRAAPVPVAELDSDEPPAPDGQRLLTTDEAAALLHVHPRTVQRLVERGELVRRPPRRAVRFDPARRRGADRAAEALRRVRSCGRV